MYLRDSLYVLARRWYVVLPVFLLLAGAVNVLTGATPYSYSSKATVVLLSPSIATRTDPTLANPYLGFSGNLQSTSMILTAAATDNDAVSALARDGATANYTVGPDPTTPDAPVLLLDAKDPNEAVSARTRDALVDFLRTDLDRRQRAAASPANVFITLSVVSASPPKRLATAKKKVLAGGAAVAFVLPMLVAFGAEGWAFRRARRRERPEATRVSAPAQRARERPRRRSREPADAGNASPAAGWLVDQPPLVPEQPRRARRADAADPAVRRFAERPTVQVGWPAAPGGDPDPGGQPDPRPDR